jgi:hypothetical protein
MDRRSDAAAADPGSRTGVSSAEEEAYVQRQNRAVDSDLIGWPESTLRWRTRRGWPTSTGWLVIAIPCLLFAASLLGLLVNGPAGHAIENLAVALLASAVAVGLVVIVPALHQPVTASWTLTVSPSFIRLDAESPGLGRTSQEIRRVDAGRLRVQSKEGYRGRRLLVSATGSSIDGRLSIRLPGDSVASAGRAGLLLRIPIAVVLISWWPANSLSVSGLLDFEQMGIPRWYPDGVPPRPMPNLRADF